MSEEEKGHWLELVKPEWLREGFMQFALAVAVRDCLDRMEKSEPPPIKLEKELTGQLRGRVWEPLVREAWLPAPPDKAGLIDKALERVRSRPAPYHEVAQSVATHFLAGKSGGDLNGSLLEALDRAYKSHWDAIDVPADAVPPDPPKLPFLPAQAWLTTALALQAWRELEPKLWPADLKWRDRCQQIRARIKARNEEGKWLASSLSWWYSTADYALFADAAKLIEQAMRRVNALHARDEQLWLGVPLPGDWKPVFIADYPTAKLTEMLKAATSSSPAEPDAAWDWLRPLLRGTPEKGPPASPPPPPIPKSGARGSEKLDALQVATEACGELQTAVVAGLARLITAHKQAHEPQFLDAKIEAALKPVVTPLEQLSRSPGSRAALAGFLMHFNALLQEQPWNVRVVPPTLSSIGKPWPADLGWLGPEPVADASAPWGQIVGLRFGPIRDKRPIGQLRPAALVAVGLTEDVVKAIIELLNSTRGNLLVDRDRNTFRTELVKSEEAFRDQFREFYRAYFRHYDTERPPTVDPTAKVFHAVCEAMDLKPFTIPTPYEEANGTEYQRLPTGVTRTLTTLDWQVHQGWRCNDENQTLFLEARGVYK